MDSYNQPIQIDGVRIMPGDILFADSDGVVVIPKNIEHKVLLKAMDSVATERSVLARIIKNEDAFFIYEKEGAF